MNKSLIKFKIGDLVYLAYDEYKIYGFGLVLDKHSHGDWEVYWFGEQGVQIDHPNDIRLVTLPEDD